MQPFEFDGIVATLLRDGTSGTMTAVGKPVRVDGFTVGYAELTQNPPHRGELHPDGDEFLFLVSGRVDVIFDDGDADSVGAETVVPLEAGQAIFVPRGVWHRIDIREPGRLIHITPGPGDGHRPL